MTWSIWRRSETTVFITIFDNMLRYSMKLGLKMFNSADTFIDWEACALSGNYLKDHPDSDEVR